MDFEALFDRYKVRAVTGRYVNLQHIEPILLQQQSRNPLAIIGHSVLGKPIYAVNTGNGKTRVLIWSQMHGNESTTTKAVLDFLNLLADDTAESADLRERFTFYIIPMLNPDGAEAYTRENAAGIDLNRDANNLTQPESKTLRFAFENFKPDYCFNMHDQRTIYGVGNTGKPATVSFLAPAYNEQRDINATRTRAMQFIAAMNHELQKRIPGQVGRFDDSFNINCVGDTFQFLNVPTILFEAGHFQADYDREYTRLYIFIALLAGLSHNYENVVVNNENDHYLNIPQNKLTFYDFVYKNVKINYDSFEKNTNFALQYRESLEAGKIVFEACFAEIGSLDGFFGHFEFNANGAVYTDDYNNQPEIGRRADFYLDGKRVSNGMID